ncbi:MAG: hypothetical protein ETSY1_00415 [Candidatus Entotheonella factor]|uniref:Response regulatory domain-containing protein n=1 Tax=Entotheonella factor TaxID=1429438 RepID=W4LZJ2_ENTF1|nr:MAG: hypothetical protein ETSY1_00415 [Candidatus Entotheonella factor]
MADLFTVELGIQDEKTRLALEDILKSRELQQQFRTQSPGAQDTPDLVIIDMQRSYREVLQRASLARRNAPQAEIFVASVHIDPEDLLHLFRENIDDFIQLPVKDYEVKQALERFLQRREQITQPTAQLGKVINLMGTKGGIGTTTIAVNLAVSLKRQDAKRKVVLVDLDYQFGDIALFLDLKPPHSIIHVAEHLSQSGRLVLQHEFMQDVLMEHDSGIYVLSAAKADEDREALTPEVVNKTIDVLRSMYDYVILDSGHVFDEVTVEILNRLPALYLVSTLHLPVIRNTARFLAYLSSFDPLHNENIRIIINRHRSQYEDISLNEFEKAYKDVFFAIPNDYPKASSFLNRAKPIPSLSRWSSIARAYKRLAAKLA